MTCRYSNTHWLDVLYVSVRKTKGGVAEAARFLTERRGKTIHAESLRAKLNGSEGESLSVEFAELLTEWMQEKESGKEGALDWLHALNAQFGLTASSLAATAGPEAGVTAVMAAYMEVSAESGLLANELQASVIDGSISGVEAQQIEVAARKAQRKLEKTIISARRAAGIA